MAEYNEAALYDEILKIISNRISTDIQNINLVELDNEIEKVGIDSLVFVRLMVEIEEQYQIEFEVEQLIASQYKTIRDLCECVKDKLLS